MTSKQKKQVRKKSSKKLVAANWKMNPKSLADAKKLLTGVRTCAATLRHVEVVAAVPFPYIAELGRLAKGKSVQLAAQDMFWEASGAYTGEVSSAMLKDVGAKTVIIGHSERRALGETDEAVSLKMHQAVAYGMTPILCVGERERTQSGAYLGLIEAQLKTALSKVQKKYIPSIVVAYEPIWAIGTGHTATPDDAHQMSIFIQKILMHLYGRATADTVRILYGGSVNPDNAETLLVHGEVDGFLVGGASLKSAEFNAILRIANRIRS